MPSNKNETKKQSKNVSLNCTLDWVKHRKEKCVSRLYFVHEFKAVGSKYISAREFCIFMEKGSVIVNEFIQVDSKMKQQYVLYIKSYSCLWSYLVNFQIKHSLDKCPGCWDIVVPSLFILSRF